MPSVCFPRISTIASLGEFASSSPLFERAVVSRVVAVFSHRGAHSTQKTTDHSLHKPSFSSDAPVSINLKRNHPTGKELHKASGLKPFTPRSSRTAFSLLVLVLHLPNVGRQVPMLRQDGGLSPLSAMSQLPWPMMAATLAGRPDRGLHRLERSGLSGPVGTRTPRSHVLVYRLVSSDHNNAVSEASGYSMGNSWSLATKV